MFEEVTEKEDVGTRKDWSAGYADILDSEGRRIGPEVPLRGESARSAKGQTAEILLARTICKALRGHHPGIKPGNFVKFGNGWQIAIPEDWLH